mmetsp:Transcript_6359/g.14771  ORF Transcript_6359/g.14771 Transcript_6359/m.14771 type:complete len:623 (+) Transcript_6359:326-2194(+)
MSFQPDKKDWSVPASPKALWKHQHTLPRLPVPDLGQTLVRYLQSVRPLVTDEQFARTVKAVSDFAVSGQGEELQRRLKKRAEEKQHTSWLVEWWNQIAYLTDRGPVVFYVSYFFGFKPFPSSLLREPPIGGGTANAQCNVAAAIVEHALNFKQMLQDETCSPDFVGKSAQCMAVYPLLFNACRIPTLPSDVVATYNPHTHSHILVARRGRFFRLEVLDAAGRRLSPQALAHQLKRVIEEADRQGPAGCGIGALTSWGRDEWARARRLLAARGGANEEALEAIQSASLVVCLDHDAGPDVSTRARQYWHGDGTNRFYDKTLQWIVLPDGRAGFLGEHAISDGGPCLRVNQYILQSIFKKPSLSSSSPPSSSAASVSPPRELKFIMDGEVQKAVQQAQAEFSKIVAEHELERVAVDGLGRDGIKAVGVGADGFCQMAIQTAYFKEHGELAPTYEACSTRGFLHGRTETVRSCSRAAAAFIKAMATCTGSSDERRKLLLTAVAAHQMQARECSAGQGVDRHLVGLKMLVGEKEAVPDIFSDPSYTHSKTWRLSTSNLSTEELESWGYGEVVPEGYGVAYSIQKARSVFTVTCRGEAGKGRAKALARAIAEVMREIRDVCGVRSKL